MHITYGSFTTGLKRLHSVNTGTAQTPALPQRKHYDSI